MDNIVSILSLIDERDVQQNLAKHIRRQRKVQRLSREKLAERSGVPASTLKRFETTGEISLKQLLRIWAVVDDLNRVNDLTKPQAKEPQSIAEVLQDEV